MRLQQTKNTKKKVYLGIFTLVVALCLGIVIYFAFLNKTDGSEFPSAKPSSNTPIADPSQTNGSTSSPKESSSTTTPINSSVTPVAPTGTFVSNHRPSLSGSSSPSQENSTCTTTPGAQCYIQFEKEGVVKSLSIQSTDSNGNTSWDWTISSIGLTEGTWKISAVAKNGTKTNISTDEIFLQVQP